VIVGVAIGIAVNSFLWLQVPWLHWMWWNVIGFVITCAGAFVASLKGPATNADQLEHYTLSGAGMFEREKKWVGTYAILVGYFILMVVVGAGVLGVASSA
jgi:hypothetical protein